MNLTRRELEALVELVDAQYQHHFKRLQDHGTALATSQPGVYQDFLRASSPAVQENVWLYESIGNKLEDELKDMPEEEDT